MTLNMKSDSGEPRAEEAGEVLERDGVAFRPEREDGDVGQLTTMVVLAGSHGFLPLARSRHSCMLSCDCYESIPVWVVVKYGKTNSMHIIEKNICTPCPFKIVSHFKILESQIILNLTKCTQWTINIHDPKWVSLACSLDIISYYIYLVS